LGHGASNRKGLETEGAGVIRLKNRMNKKQLRGGDRKVHPVRTATRRGRGKTTKKRDSIKSFQKKEGDKTGKNGGEKTRRRR